VIVTGIDFGQRLLPVRAIVGMIGIFVRQLLTIPAGS
jgi:hypothetical protein